MLIRSASTQHPRQSTCGRGVFREEFGLADPDYNPWLAQRLLANSRCVERALPDHITRRSLPGQRCLMLLSPEGGRIYLVIDHNDGLPPRITHHFRYRKSWVRWLRLEVVQHIQIWSDLPAPIGYHDWLLFDMLAANRRAISSDSLLAEDSNRFWYNRLPEAQRRGYAISMVDWVHHRQQPWDSRHWEAFRKQARELGRWSIGASMVIGPIA